MFYCVEIYWWDVKINLVLLELCVVYLFGKLLVI